jgi:hypothetical protein
MRKLSENAQFSAECGFVFRSPLTPDVVSWILKLQEYDIAGILETAGWLMKNLQIHYKNKQKREHSKKNGKPLKILKFKNI